MPTLNPTAARYSHPLWKHIVMSRRKPRPLQFKMMCERPPRSLRSRLPLTRGRLNACNVRALFSPSVRGRAAEGGRGSLTSHTSRWAGQESYLRAELFSKRPGFSRSRREAAVVGPNQRTCTITLNSNINSNVATNRPTPAKRIFMTIGTGLGPLRCSSEKRNEPTMDSVAAGLALLGSNHVHACELFLEIFLFTRRAFVCLVFKFFHR